MPFGGKTFLLSLLVLTEALTLEVSVTVLGGSGQQSARVLDAMGARSPRRCISSMAPRACTPPGSLWGNTVTALTASQPSVRGAHPARLRLDEADEMRLPILEAAQGQPMDQGAVRAQTVIASTHQHPDGTMTAVLRRAAEQGWLVYEWCYRETLEPHGWLTEDQVTRKAHRNHGPDVAHGIRPPGTERGGTGDRSGGRGVGLRRRPRRGRRGRARGGWRSAYFSQPILEGDRSLFPACTFAPGAQAMGTIGEFSRKMARPAGFEPATLGLEGPVNRPGFPRGSMFWEDGVYGTTEEVFTRGPGASGATGVRSRASARFAMGGDSVGGREDRVHCGDAAALGAPS